MESTSYTNKIPNEENEQEALLKIATFVKSIKYGYIQITITDSRIVQIDKTEKFRFNDQKSK